MQETLIEFETGKLAKEKNFNIPCDARWWMEFGSWKESKQGAVKCKNSEEYSISRPTQSLLAKWLREVHNIIVTPLPTKTKWFFNIQTPPPKGKGILSTRLD